VEGPRPLLLSSLLVSLNRSGKEEKMSDASSREPSPCDGEPVVAIERDRDGETSGTTGSGQTVVPLTDIKKDPGGDDDQ
jgi:hypothetical protein